MGMHWEFGLEVEFDTKEHANDFGKKVLDYFKKEGNVGDGFKMQKTDFEFWLRGEGDTLEDDVNIDKNTVTICGESHGCLVFEKWPDINKNVTVEDFFTELREYGAKKSIMFFDSLDRFESFTFANPIPRGFKKLMCVDSKIPKSDVIQLFIDEETLDELFKGEDGYEYNPCVLEGAFRDVLKKKEDPEFKVCYTWISDYGDVDTDYLDFD